jgi:hypothetical protein
VVGSFWRRRGYSCFTFRAYDRVRFDQQYGESVAAAQGFPWSG